SFPASLRVPPRSPLFPYTTLFRSRDAIYRTGAEVKALSDDKHSSGHANKSDLQLMINLLNPENVIPIQGEYRLLDAHARIAHETDRKSTRLNSSHVSISYAVFCLK